jgi:tetraacyldisaccharide-1-P 4'-kinase
MMTEKDAVKCLDLNLDRHWVVSLHAQLETGAIAWLHSKLES